MAEFIYSMRKVRKAHGDKVILDDVSLNFLPGAKIGVVGPNGAGKSSVLRIMAGLDTPNNGDALLAPGATVGILQQEPHAERGEDRPRQRRGGPRRHQGQARPVQRGGRADGHRLLRRADGGDGPAAGGSGPRRRVGPRLPAGAGDGRAALPAARRARHAPLRRRAPSRRALQAAAVQARPAAARRADQPPRRRERAVARTAPGRVQGRDPGRHARPVLPGQRRRVDPRTRSRPRLPLRGQLLDLPGEEGRAHRGAGPQGRQAAEAAARTSWRGSAPA